jgi:hypothetical protein
MPPPIAPWTARPLLLEAAQASRWIYAPRFGRQMRVDVLDDDASARETTQFHHGVCDGRDSLDLHLVIPKALCVATTSEGQPRMPGSAVLGCFDHFSTYAISEVSSSWCGVVWCVTLGWRCCVPMCPRATRQPHEMQH